MGGSDLRTERIKYSIEILRLCWLTLLATGSGTLGLFLGELSIRSTVFAALGRTAVGSLLVATMIVDARIRSLLRGWGEE